MDRYDRATWIFLALWFVVCLFTLNYNGPFKDEGIYVTAGYRLLEGHGQSDGYLVWFGGSYLWPLMAAAGHHLAGLFGTRLVTLLCGTVALVAVVLATRNLFGRKAGFWTAVALGVNGALLLVSRLAAYDAPAAAGIAVSFWAITELWRRDNRLWLILSALAYLFGMFAKYPAGAMLIPILALLVVLRRSKAILDIGILGFISAAVAFGFALPYREQLAGISAWRAENMPTFGVTLAMTKYRIVYASFAPFLLAVGGWLVAKGRRWLSSILLLSMLIWPAYHLGTTNPVSVNKHLLFGFLFAYPLVGLFLSWLWEGQRIPILAARGIVLVSVCCLTLFGIVQVYRFDHNWTDIRQSSAYLAHQVEPGDQLLIADPWPYTLELYTQGRIESPWDVFDPYRIEHGQSEIDLCEYDWYVDSGYDSPWPASVRDTIEECGSFVPVYEDAVDVVGLGHDLVYYTYPWPTTIWQNTAKGPAND